jgi:hypothetical protein
MEKTLKRPYLFMDKIPGREMSCFTLLSLRLVKNLIYVILLLSTVLVMNPTLGGTIIILVLN